MKSNYYGAYKPRRKDFKRLTSGELKAIDKKIALEIANRIMPFPFNSVYRGNG